jgi:hypothetical protein
MEKTARIAFLWMQAQFTRAFSVGIDAAFTSHKHTQNSGDKNLPRVSRIQMNQEQQDFKTAEEL